MQTFGLLADPGHLGLATDLYQLTMAAAYWENGLGQETSTFELFVRRLPAHRGYLLTAGLEQVVEYLQNLRFGAEGIAYLRSQPQFGAVSESFWEYLRDFRFTGDLDAMPEGTAAFANEPLLRVRAPLIEAQMVETFLLTTLNHQTLIATKAARMVEAAGGKDVIEFGARRAHGFDSALFAARAAVIGGCVGTSNVLAGARFGLRLYGTAAHSFTMAFPTEQEAFAAYHRVFPRSCILLVDTYDTLEGARRAAELGPSVRGVRLDSGDMATQSRQVREILDQAGLQETVIIASGDLNEEKIAALEAAGSPINSYGVGTDLTTSRDAPALGGVYKLVAVEEAEGHRPVRKLSEGKATYPDVKQVFRQQNRDGQFTGDVLALKEEATPGEPLLAPVLRSGQLEQPLPTLETIRAHARQQLRALPEGVRRRCDPDAYPVALSPGLERLIAAMDQAPHE